MAFPSTVLPVTFAIAPGANPAAGESTWTWTDITGDVRVEQGVVIEAGRGDESSAVDPGKCTLTLNNRSGNYSPRNPLGTWYGQLRRNTPLRVTVRAASDTFTRTSASGWGTTDDGQAWMATPVGSGGTVAATDFTVDGSQARHSVPVAVGVRVSYLNDLYVRDADVSVSLTVPAATGGNLEPANISLRRTDDGITYYLARVTVAPGGAVQCLAFANTASGSATLGTATVASLTHTGQQLRVRVRLSGSSLAMKVWAASGSEPASWHLTVDDDSITDPGRIGVRSGIASGNTNTKPVSFAYDNLSVDADLFVGTVPEWPVRWDQSAKDCTTPIVAAGVIRRLQQGASPLRSPIARNFLKIDPVGYWPLEDGSDATAAASAVTGSAAAIARNVTFGSDTSLPGASSTITMAANSVIVGRPKAHTAASAWSLVMYIKLNAVPGVATQLISVASTGTIKRWELLADATGYVANGYDSTDTVVQTRAGVFAGLGIQPTGWVALHLGLTISGGTVSWVFLVHAVGSTDFYSFGSTLGGGSYAGTLGVPTSFSIYGSAGYTDGHVGHVLLHNSTVSFVAGDFTAASNGYINETAADRVTRLCSEEGVPALVEAGTSEALGRQDVDTFLNLLRTAETADMGILYEQGASLAYRPRGGRYNRTVDLALNVASGHLAAPPEPTDDDQRVRNDITVSRPDGSQARATDDIHIAEQGRYDEAVTLNVASDDQLPDQAAWRLYLGTYDEMRWPRIEVNLARNPSLIPGWLRCGIGSRMTITNPPAQVAGGDIDVIIEGYSQRLGPYDWDVSLSCSPAKPWDIGVLDDTSLGRADTDGSQLSSGVTSSATSLSVATTSGPLWVTSGGEFPFNISVDGEVMTVTAISGTSSPQTFTVTRSVNGITKSHSAGADVRLATPMIVGL